MKHATPLLFAPLLVFAASTIACGSKHASPELRDARHAYERARVGPAAQANPAGLREAKRVLDDAERKLVEDPGSEEARHLAYVAERKALAAEAEARAAIAEAQRVKVEETLAVLRTKETKERLPGDKDTDTTEPAEQKARTGGKDDLKKGAPGSR